MTPGSHSATDRPLYIGRPELILPLPLSVQADYLGELNANPFDFDSTANPFGAGSPFKPDGINNPFSPYGSPISNQSATNPFATDAPRLYDQQKNYRGKLSTNPYESDSMSNPFGRYGSPFFPDTINNPFGARTPYSSNSPTNPYGRGLRIEGKRARGVHLTHPAELIQLALSWPSFFLD